MRLLKLPEYYVRASGNREPQFIPRTLIPFACQKIEECAAKPSIG